MEKLKQALQRAAAAGPSQPAPSFAPPPQMAPPPMMQQTPPQPASDPQAQRKRKSGWDEEPSAAQLEMTQSMTLASMLGSSPPQNSMALAIPGQQQQMPPGIPFGAIMPAGAAGHLGMGPSPGRTIPDGREAPVAGVDGNWECTGCHRVNFSNRSACFHCLEKRAAGGGEDSIDAAATSALERIRYEETEWDFDKLRWKVASYFRKSANTVTFAGQFNEVLTNFADAAFSTLSGTLGDRSWMPQMDFNPVLNAAVKQLFPPELMAQVDPMMIDNVILVAHDRAFENARVMPVIWESMTGKVEGKKNQKKIYNALEVGRNEAIKAIETNIQTLPVQPTALEKVQQFIIEWVNGATKDLANGTGGEPENALAEDVATKIFQFLLKNNTIPTFLQRELMGEGQMLPQSFPAMGEVVKQSYRPYIERAIKKRRSQPKFEYCKFFFNGWCGYGDKCQNAHADEEMAPSALAAMGKGPDGMPKGWGGKDMMGKGCKGKDMMGKGCGGKDMGFGGKDMGFGGKDMMGKGWGGKDMGKDMMGKGCGGKDMMGKGQFKGGKDMGKDMGKGKGKDMMGKGQFMGGDDMMGKGQFMPMDGGCMGADGGFMGADGGFMGADGGFMGADGGCMGADGGFMGAAGGFMGADGGCMGADGGCMGMGADGGFMGADSMPPGIIPDGNLGALMMGDFMEDQKGKGGKGKFGKDAPSGKGKVVLPPGKQSGKGW